MEAIKKILAFSILFLFVTWGSYQLENILRESPNVVLFTTFGDFVSSFIISILKIIVMLILLIPGFIYLIIHLIFYPADAPSTDIQTIYTIIIGTFFWILLEFIHLSNDAKKNKRVNIGEKANYNVYQNNYASRGEDKSTIHSIREDPNNNLLTPSLSTYNEIDNDSDDSEGTTDTDTANEDIPSDDDSNGYDETTNESVKQDSGWSILPTNCSDCDSPGDGKCSECHGTGFENDVFEALAESLTGQSQKCKKCNNSGKCQTCYGRGYFNT